MILQSNLPIGANISTSLPQGAAIFMWIPLMTIIPIICFMSIYLRRSIKHKQVMYYYLFVLFLFSVVNQIFSLDSLFMNSSLNVYVFKISEITMLTASYLLLLILELFENNKLVSKIGTFFMISYSILIFTMITDNQITENQMGNLQSLEFEQGGVISILITIFSSIALLWVIWIYFQNRKLLANKMQIRIVNFLFLGIILTQLMGSLLPAVLQTSLSR